jgi:hypothetical protein
MKNFLVIAVTLGLAAGCGGDDDKLARELTTEEYREKCEEANANAPTEDVTCQFMGMDIVLEAEDFQADCDAITENPVPDTCDVTVGQVDDCDDALGDDPCAAIEGDLPAACEPLATEACSGEEEARTLKQRLPGLRAKLMSQSRI